MPYLEKHILTKNLGNNGFAWEDRSMIYGKSPTLTIPAVIEGTIDDVKVGDTVAFEEMENEILRSCVGLKNFVSLEGSSEGNVLPKKTVILDNHNHALYFWLDAVRKSIIEKGFELIHIDEHSDLWGNENILDLERGINDENYAWEFTNLKCNVGNYIEPAINSGLVGKMIRIENEFQIDEYMKYSPRSNSVLNLDLDIFAPELDHINEGKKIAIIRNLLSKVRYVTIATSPYFIDQGRAIEKLKKILLK